jgi:hypothetical protein
MGLINSTAGLFQRCCQPWNSRLDVVCRESVGDREDRSDSC